MEYVRWEFCRTEQANILKFWSIHWKVGHSTLGGAPDKAYGDVNQRFRWQVYSLKQIYYKIFYFLLNLKLKEKF